MDQDYVIELRNQLINEYKASIPSEMMIDLTVNAYFRSQRYASVYAMFIQNADGSLRNNSQLHLNMMKEFSKQIEMANRQFLTCLAFLKELNRLSINVSVQAKQAFVGQNQKFNKMPNDFGKNYDKNIS